MFQNKSFLISLPVYPALFSVEIRQAKNQNTIISANYTEYDLKNM